jgi:predicted nucleic acid-binding Zn ribbon protein
MPLYQFECVVCHKVEERLQVGYEPVVPRCLECGPWMQLVIAPSTVIYQGDGWAKKDRRGGTRG